VTVSVESVDFLQPVEVGDLVSLMARVNHVGSTSLVVGIKVTAENVKERLVKHTNTSYFTMVAKDDDNSSAKVPGLRLTNEEQIRRFAESILRKDLKKYHKKSMNDMRASFDLNSELTELDDHNCLIDLQP
jgi:Acyl-CoA hydrolase